MQGAFYPYERADPNPTIITFAAKRAAAAALSLSFDGIELAAL